MRVLDLIVRKRDGLALSRAEIESLVLGYTAGEVLDYQVAAWLMAVFLRGLDRRETADLTAAMVRSGRTVDWSGRLPFVVDKHSTGGVGDKTTLVVAPMVAAAGVPVAKMSGRGLGFTGGTLDKLESIPGLSVQRSVAELQSQVERIGLAIVAQSPELAPADGKLYALRDATGTVESLPLIASSVMAKKLAAGAHGIVLDVKAGNGAFARTMAEAVTLAELMLDLGRAAQRRMRAVISAMDEPLGTAVGNALEVAEAIRALAGQGPDDLRELALVLGSQMLLLARAALDEAAARRRLLDALASGEALAKLAQMVEAQGGDPRALEDTRLLPRAPHLLTVACPRDGFVAGIDARTVGEAVVELGGGRAKKGDAIDPRVGVVFQARAGAHAEVGSPLFVVHAADEAAAARAAQRVLAAYRWSADPPPRRRLVLDVLE